MPACGPLAVTAQPPFAAAALKARDSASVRHWITVAPGQQAFYGLPDARIVERAGRLAVGLIGIDRRELWVYLDPTDPVAPVVRAVRSARRVPAARARSGRPPAGMERT